MYDTQQTVNLIKQRAKLKKLSIGEMLSFCELSKNALSSMQSRGSWLQANNLAKIADYLDCSVDYLLGRTDVPEVNRNDNKVTLITNPGIDVQIAAASGKEYTAKPTTFADEVAHADKIENSRK